MFLHEEYCYKVFLIEKMNRQSLTTAMFINKVEKMSSVVHIKFSSAVSVYYYNTKIVP